MKDTDIKKYIKQAVKEARVEFNKDVKRDMGAYKEEMHGYVKTATEQYLDIQKTLSGHSRILESHTERIGEILMDSNEIKSRLNKIQLDVSLDLDRKVDKKHFIDMELRLRKLEKK